MSYQTSKSGSISNLEFLGDLTNAKKSGPFICFCGTVFEAEIVNVRAKKITSCGCTDEQPVEYLHPRVYYAYLDRSEAITRYIEELDDCFHEPKKIKKFMFGLEKKFPVLIVPSSEVIPNVVEKIRVLGDKMDNIWLYLSAKEAEGRNIELTELKEAWKNAENLFDNNNI